MKCCRNNSVSRKVRIADPREISIAGGASRWSRLPGCLAASANRSRSEVSESLTKKRLRSGSARGRRHFKVSLGNGERLYVSETCRRGNARFITLSGELLRGSRGAMCDVFTSYRDVSFHDWPEKSEF